jgi:hypothetical protein
MITTRKSERSGDPAEPHPDLRRHGRSGTRNGRDLAKQASEHVADVGIERGGQRTKRNDDKTSQNRVFHRADTALVANKKLEKFAHFKIPNKNEKVGVDPVSRINTG